MNGEVIVILVSVLGICVLLPAFVVWMVSRRKMCEARERTQIALAFLKSHPECNLEELVSRITPKVSENARLLPLLWVGIFFGIVTAALLTIAAVADFASEQGKLFFGFITVLSGAVSTSSLICCLFLRRRHRRS